MNIDKLNNDTIELIESLESQSIQNGDDGNTKFPLVAVAAVLGAVAIAGLMTFVIVTAIVRAVGPHCGC